MTDLMDDRGPDFVADFVFGAGKTFQRLLKDENDVRRVVAVIGPPFVQGNAVVEAEQVPGGTEAHVGDDFGGGEILYQDGHVFDPFAEILGKAVDRLGDQLLESLPG